MADEKKKVTLAEEKDVKNARDEENLSENEINAVAGSGNRYNPCVSGRSITDH